MKMLKKLLAVVLTGAMALTLFHGLRRQRCE